MEQLNGSATVVARFPDFRKYVNNGSYYVDLNVNNPHIRVLLTRRKGLEVVVDDKPAINGQDGSVVNFGVLNIKPTFISASPTVFSSV